MEPSFIKQEITNTFALLINTKKYNNPLIN